MVNKTDKYNITRGIVTFSFTQQKKKTIKALTITQLFWLTWLFTHRNKILPYNLLQTNNDKEKYSQDLKKKTTTWYNEFTHKLK